MRVRIEDDFSPALIAESGQCFRWNDGPDGSLRVIHAGSCVYIKALSDDEYEFSCSEDEYESIWRPYLDMDVSYAGIRESIDKETDPWLYEAAVSQRGIRILRQDTFEALISFIISQNRNIPAIKRSIELLCDAAGEERTDTKGMSYRTFPESERIAALTDEELDGCRLGYRTSYVKRTAELVASGELDLEELNALSDDRLTQKLMSLYGVGAKVANCVLLFGYHRLDAFPVDVWIKRILAAHYPDGYDTEKYRPYNGVMQQYMFAHARAEGI